MIEREAYSFTTEYVGLKEIVGPNDERMIEVAHRLCKVEGPKGGLSTDEIPWCSSWANLAIVCANIRRNPKKSIEMLKDKGIEESLIVECFKYSKMEYEINKALDTLKPLVPPTWSASSLSWDNWGNEVPHDKARRGDIVRIKRQGGGHVAFLDEDSPGVVVLKLLGGNQKDSICSVNFLRTGLVTIRRSND